MDKNNELLDLLRQAVEARLDLLIADPDKSTAQELEVCARIITDYLF